MLKAAAALAGWRAAACTMPLTAPGHRFFAANLLLSYSGTQSVAVGTRRRLWQDRDLHSCAILDGKAASVKWTAQLQSEVHHLRRALRRPPCLAVVLVGNRGDSVLYVTRKQEACKQVGIEAQIHRLPASVSQDQLDAAVSILCDDSTVDGVLIQFPLPAHINEQQVLEKLDPRKDVDGFHPLNVGRLALHATSQPRFVPCTPLGILQLLQHYRLEVRGKNVVIVGNSNVVGMPLALLMGSQGAGAVTICNKVSHRIDSATRRSCNTAQQEGLSTSFVQPLPASMPAAQKNEVAFRSLDPSHGAAEIASIKNVCNSKLAAITRSADILMVAAGCPGLVQAHWVKPGATVIDVGTNVISLDDVMTTQTLLSGNYFVLGDVAFDEVSHVAAAITPVPGGVGPMTIAAVIHNTIEAAKANHQATGH